MKISSESTLMMIMIHTFIPMTFEQRMRKQLLWLMYILSKDKEFHRIPNRITRRAGKIVFKLP